MFYYAILALLAYGGYYVYSHQGNASAGANGWTPAVSTSVPALADLNAFAAYLGPSVADDERKQVILLSHPNKDSANEYLQAMAIVDGYSTDKATGKRIWKVRYAGPALANTKTTNLPPAMGTVFVIEDASFYTG